MVTSSPARFGPRHPSHENALAPQDLKTGMLVILHYLGSTREARITRDPYMEEGRWVMDIVTAPHLYPSDMDTAHIPWWDRRQVGLAEAGVTYSEHDRRNWTTGLYVSKAASY
jgi:hypothetical protein